MSKGTGSKPNSNCLSSSVSMFIEDSRDRENGSSDFTSSFPRLTPSVVSSRIFSSSPSCSASQSSLFVERRTIKEINHRIQRQPREIIHKIKVEGSEPQPPIVKEEIIKPNLNNGEKVEYRERRRTTHSLEPEISFVTKVQRPSSLGLTSTSLNLTLRSPTSPTKGEMTNSLIYSSISNSRDGYESQVQIQLGPRGGSISATRRKSPNPSHSQQIDQMKEDLIAAQLERKEKLVQAINNERIRVLRLQTEIKNLRAKLHPRPNLDRMKEENHRLRLECDLMTREVDLYDNGTVPLGETSEEFYREINPGQEANALFENTGYYKPRGSKLPGNPPPLRPPPPKFDQDEWPCSSCTFRNHPDLMTCEQCNMIRIIKSPCTPNPLDL